MKVTIMGLLNVPQQITEHLTYEDALSFKCLSTEENELLRNCFLRMNYERPVLVYDPKYFFDFLRNTCDVLETNVNTLKEAFKATFNPVENYDRIEETHKYIEGRTNTENSSNSDATNSNKSDTESYQTNDSTQTNVNKVSAFDTKTMSTHDTHDTNISDKNINTVNGNEENHSRESINGIGNSASESNEKTVSRIHGNIGVTTATKMIEEVIDLYNTKNFYEIVCNMIVTKSQLFYYLFN